MHIRADKFYPPTVDTPQFLFRDRVVEDLVRRCGARKPAVVLEAQAGQGKTTVIKQFLDRSGVASVWYQVGPEDADPALFLAAIRACFVQALPDCTKEELLKPGGGDVTPFDLPRHVDRLIAGLAACLKTDLYIVFDDLHNLLPHEASLLVLDHLVEHAPPKLHFVLSSRAPLPLTVCQSPPGGRNLVRAGNSELTLSPDEIADFFSRVLGLPISQEAVNRLSRETDGWVMGVVLLGLQMIERRGEPPAVGREAADGGILEYFRRRVFSPLEPRLHRPLTMLSLLEEIPVDLAVTVTGVLGIGADLADLARRNVFIRPLDAAGAVYGMHHLFREFLRDKAAAELDGRDVAFVLRRAGNYFFGLDNYALALRYFHQAGDLASLEAALQQCGAAMLAANQTATLAAILGKIPESALAGMGFAPFYLALAHLDQAPARALPLLSQALEVFSAKNDRHGELLCLAHLISIHITTTGHYREGGEILTRAEDLYAQLADSLDPPTSVLLANSLSIGRCIFLADADNATRYANAALALARKEGLVNFEAALLMVMGYIRIFAGRMSLARLWLEQAYAALNRPDVGTFNRLAIRMMLFNFLFHDGDFDNYFDQKNQLVALVGRQVFTQSIAGPFRFVWEMDIEINRGRYEEALGLASAISAQIPEMSPHIESQINQLKSVALALLGRGEEALAAAAASAGQRERSGGLYFIALNKIVTGLTHGLCDRFDEALTLLDEGIAGTRSMPTAYLEACGLMHRACVHLARGDGPAAETDLAAALTLMRRNEYRHFWAWSRQAMQRLLGLAVARGIEPEYARSLAAERLDCGLTAEGQAVPRLEFRVLGGFSMFSQGEKVLDAESLTPAQRELICLLLASPGLKMVQETAQLHFWPESSDASAKTKFDTLLSRLRKTLAEAAPDAAVARHFNRDKGIVWLTHCRVDALDFLALVKRGLAHDRAREYWQAENAFTRAEALWRGEFAPGISGEDMVRALRDRLTAALSRMALAWCERLAETDRLSQAVDLAEKALVADPLGDALWGLLYRLNGRRSAIAARKTLSRFADTLRAEDYTEREIAELIKIVSQPRPTA